MTFIHLQRKLQQELPRHKRNIGRITGRWGKLKRQDRIPHCPCYHGYTLLYSWHCHLDFWEIYALHTAVDDGMMPHTLLTAERINQIVQSLPYNSALIWSPKPTAAPVIRQLGRIHSDHSHNNLSEYEYSHTALIGLLYSLSNYQEAVEEHRQSHDPAFYLKHQLSWLDQQYDEVQWIGYQESLNAINQYLSSHSEIWMNKFQQIEFTQGLLFLLEKHPVPISDIKCVCSNYKKNHKKLPGKKKINDILSRLGLSHTITSKQISPVNRQTHWKVCQK